MKNRRFGVELEFNSAGLDRQGVAEVLREAFDREGLQRWYFMDRLDYDGSDLELRTPILRGKEGLKKLEVTMNTLADAGCYTTSGDGMHVHHDAPEFVYSIDNCIKIVKSWNANRHLIYQFVEPMRTEGDGDYWACPRWTEEQIRTMERNREIPAWDRNDLNLMALREHGSIEIRLHEGTLNYREAESWILFGQRFIDRVLAHSMRDSKTPDKLLEKVRVSPAAKNALLTKSQRGGTSARDDRFYNYDW